MNFSKLATGDNCLLIREPKVVESSYREPIAAKALKVFYCKLLCAKNMKEELGI